MGYIDEEGKWKRFGSSPVKDAYWKQVTLTKCKKCGVEHGMGIYDRITEVHTPIDLCYDCIFSGCRYEPITTQIDIDEKDWAEALRKAQDRIIRDMIISSASTLAAPDSNP